MNQMIRDTQGPKPDATAMAAIAAIAHKEAGIIIAPGKISLVQSRLAKRLRDLSLPDYKSYIALVESPEGAVERRQMISSLTTNVSHFFREAHHFEYLHSKVLPPLAAGLRAGGRLRIWSAGCSNGQEVHSIAMTLLDTIPDAGTRDVRLLATDIDPVVIAFARRATYDEAALEPVPTAMRSKYFTRTDLGMRLSEPVRRLVTFQELNLHGAWPMKGQFDVIFCRNVVIYFDKAMQDRLWSRFAAALKPGGWLFVGHSERVPTGAGLGFDTAGITTYRLVGGGD